jgi:hypothetical protein
LYPVIQSAEYYFHHTSTVPAAPPADGFLDFHFQISVPNEFMGLGDRGNIYVCTDFYNNLGGSVGIAMEYGLDGQGFGIRFPARARNVSPQHID